MMNTKKTYEADNLSLNSDSINEAMAPNLPHLDTSTCYLKLMFSSSISMPLKFMPYWCVELSTATYPRPGVSLGPRW